MRPFTVFGSPLRWGLLEEVVAVVGDDKMGFLSIPCGMHYPSGILIVLLLVLLCGAVEPHRAWGAEPKGTIEQAMRLVELGRHDKAAVMLEELTRQNPRDALVLTLLGQEYMALDRPREARVVFGRGLRFAPADEYLRAMVELLAPLGQAGCTLTAATARNAAGQSPATPLLVLVGAAEVVQPALTICRSVPGVQCEPLLQGAGPLQTRYGSTRLLVLGDADLPPDLEAVAMHHLSLPIDVQQLNTLLQEVAAP